LSALVVKNKDEYPQLLIYAAKMQELFETVDLDKNQVLDREEFKALLTEVDKNLVELPVPPTLLHTQSTHVPPLTRSVALASRPRLRLHRRRASTSARP
jgi:hypothetical protein